MKGGNSFIFPDIILAHSFPQFSTKDYTNYPCKKGLEILRLGTKAGEKMKKLWIKKSYFYSYSTSPVIYAFKLIRMCFWRSLVIVIGDAQTSNKKTLIKLLMQVISVYQSTITTVMFYLYIHTVFMHILHAYLLKNINNVIWYHGSLV